MPTAVPALPVPWRPPPQTGSPVRVSVTHVADPLCPWAYSFEPVLRTVEARCRGSCACRSPRCRTCSSPTRAA